MCHSLSGHDIADIDDAVDDWRRPSWNLIHGDVAGGKSFVCGRREEKDVSTMECGFHRATNQQLSTCHVFKL